MDVGVDHVGDWRIDLTCDFSVWVIEVSLCCVIYPNRPSRNDTSHDASIVWLRGKTKVSIK